MLTHLFLLSSLSYRETMNQYHAITCFFTLRVYFTEYYIMKKTLSLKWNVTDRQTACNYNNYVVVCSLGTK